MDGNRGVASFFEGFKSNPGAFGLGFALELKAGAVELKKPPRSELADAPTFVLRAVISGFGGLLGTGPVLVLVM